MGKSGSPLTPDHPREYGENPDTRASPDTRAGSSPRIRGEFHGVTVTGQPLGIIPANTGRIIAASRVKTVDRDHPREYGENTREVIE